MKHKKIFPIIALAMAMVSAYARTIVVDKEYDGASDSNAGTPEEPFLTINGAAQVAEPGDVVLIRPGLYRERVTPARGGLPDAPIIYRAEKRGKVTIRGSDVWEPSWAVIDGPKGLYSAPLNLALFRDWRPFRDPRLATVESPFHEEIIPSNGQDKLANADKLKGPPLTVRARPTDTKTWAPVIGQIFADGTPLHQVFSVKELEALSGSYTVDATGKNILIHLPLGIESPQELNWEITTREKIFAPAKRGLGFINVEDIVFEHAANQAPWPSVGAVSVRNGHDWVIRGCTIRMTQSVGLDIGGEWFDGTRLFGDAPNSYGHLIENCLISDNGMTGIYGYEVKNIVIRNNEISGSNRLGFVQALSARWEEYSGIKLLHAKNIQILDNYVHDNHAYGIWFDNQWQGSRISRNLVVDNQFGGIFIEYGQAPDAPLIIDNNIVMFTDEGSGIYTHDSSDIVIAHNLLYNNKDYGVWMWAVSPRGGLKGGTRNNRILGNLFYGNGAGNIGFPAEGEINTNNLSNYNLFANKTWARGVDDATFSIHESYSNPGVSRADVAKYITGKLQGTTGIYGGLDYTFWRAQPVRSITLPQWQAITGNDHKSGTNWLKKSLYRPDIKQFDFIPLMKWREVHVPSIEGVERDYFGQEYSVEDFTIAGPFLLTDKDFSQSMEYITFGRDSEGNLIQRISKQQGRQRLNLWPKISNQ